MTKQKYLIVNLILFIFISIVSINWILNHDEIKYDLSKVISMNFAWLVISNIPLYIIHIFIKK